MTPLQLAMAFTLKEEGTYTVDDGGPTMYGVTQVVYDDYLRSKELHLQSIRLITMSEVADIMQSEYWNPARCDQMPVKLAICMFDIAFNSGVSEAIKLLQHALGITADGQYGGMTDAAMHNTLAMEIPNAPHGLIPRFLDERRAFYHNLVTKNPVKYGAYLQGWLNRVNALEAYVANL